MLHCLARQNDASQLVGVAGCQLLAEQPLAPHRARPILQPTLTWTHMDAHCIAQFVRGCTQRCMGAVGDSGGGHFHVSWLSTGIQPICQKYSEFPDASNHLTACTLGHSQMTTPEVLMMVVRELLMAVTKI